MSDNYDDFDWGEAQLEFTRFLMEQQQEEIQWRKDMQKMCQDAGVPYLTPEELREYNEQMGILDPVYLWEHPEIEVPGFENQAPVFPAGYEDLERQWQITMYVCNVANTDLPQNYNDYP